MQQTVLDPGKDFFTAFDLTAVEFLETLNVPIHKIASFELLDLPMVGKMARTGKSLILSTGMSPHEFKAVVESVRQEEKELGYVHYGESGPEAKSRVFRRSLFVFKPMQAGEEFRPENIPSIRPMNGLAPKHPHDILARHAARNSDARTPLTHEHVA